MAMFSIIKRWKEIRHLFLLTRKPEHIRGSLENALWYFGNNGITCNHFVHAIMNEFNFPTSRDPEMNMEAHLRWLYWSFPNGMCRLSVIVYLSAIVCIRR